MDLLTFFDVVYCVNLERRPERWEAFTNRIPKDWPFRPVMQVKAIDGLKCPPPPTWSNGPGAWGCYRTHLRLIEEALNKGLDSILLLEDDAVFVNNFTSEVRKFLQNVPDDWGMLYLGGQHLEARAHPPKEVAKGVFRPWNVNRTHAYALRGETMRAVYQHLCRNDWDEKHHIDHHLGEFHKKQEHPIYCPANWLVGQAEGVSDICQSKCRERLWPSAVQYTKKKLHDQPFVAVLGLHSSGSSCVAGILYFLGVHIGNKLVGYYGDEPDKGKCGYEAIGLMNLCEQAIPFPSTNYRMNGLWIFRRLEGFINEKRREAIRKGTIAGGKYPQLCRMTNQLSAAAGEGLRVIAIDRPLEDCIASIKKRCPDYNTVSLEEHQRWLHEGKEEFCSGLTGLQLLRIDFNELIEQPETQVRRIISFLEIAPSEEQVKRAIQHVRPEMVHVK